MNLHQQKLTKFRRLIITSSTLTSGAEGRLSPVSGLPPHSCAGRWVLLMAVEPASWLQGCRPSASASTGVPGVPESAWDQARVGSIPGDGVHGGDGRKQPLSTRGKVHRNKPGCNSPRPSLSQDLVTPASCISGLCRSPGSWEAELDWNRQRNIIRQY